MKISHHLSSMIHTPMFLKEKYLISKIKPCKKDVHIIRKLWHFLTGLSFIGMYLFCPKPIFAVWISSSLLVLVFTLEFLRLKTPEINATIIRFFGPFMRQHEARAMSTMPHYLLATVLSFSLFPKDVAILSILFLASADPIASYFGIRWGKYSPKLAPNRSLIGTLAGVITCLFITWFYCSSLPFNHRIILTLVGGFSGGLAELLPIDIDDNLTIPMVSGFSLWLTYLLLAA